MTDIYRLRLDWTLLDGAEKASQTFHVLGPDDELSALMVLAASALTSGWPTIDQELDLSTVLTRVVGSRLQDTTPWHAQETIEGALNLAGSQNFATFPPQIAIVCTLKTASASRSGRGRVYMPPPITTKIDTATSRVPQATMDAYGDFVRDFLQALIDDAGNEWIPCVFSRTYSGGMTPITSVQVGNVFDTQRRRRDDLIESRSSYNITP